MEGVKKVGRETLRPICQYTLKLLQQARIDLGPRSQKLGLPCGRKGLKHSGSPAALLGSWNKALAAGA